MLQIPSFAIIRVRMDDIRKEMMREVKGYHAMVAISGILHSN
jgi:hypothetical protein